MKINNPDLLRYFYRNEFRKTVLDLKSLLENFSPNDKIEESIYFSIYNNILYKSPNCLFKQIKADRDIDKNSKLIDFLPPNEVKKCTEALIYVKNKLNTEYSLLKANNQPNQCEIVSMDSSKVFRLNIDALKKYIYNLTKYMKYPDYDDYDKDTSKKIIKYHTNAYKISFSYKDLTALRTFNKVSDKTEVSLETKKKNQKKVEQARKSLLNTIIDQLKERFNRPDCPYKLRTCIDVYDLFKKFEKYNDEMLYNIKTRPLATYLVYFIDEAPELLESRDFIDKANMYKMLESNFAKIFDEKTQTLIALRENYFENQPYYQEKLAVISEEYKKNKPPNSMNKDEFMIFITKKDELDGEKRAFARHLNDNDIMNVFRQCAIEFSLLAKKFYKNCGYNPQYSTPLIKSGLISNAIYNEEMEATEIPKKDILLSSIKKFKEMSQNESLKADKPIPQETLFKSSKYHSSEPARCVYESKYQMEND